MNYRRLITSGKKFYIDFNIFYLKRFYETKFNICIDIENIKNFNDDDK